MGKTDDGHQTGWHLQPTGAGDNAWTLILAADGDLIGIIRDEAIAVDILAACNQLVEDSRR